MIIPAQEIVDPDKPVAGSQGDDDPCNLRLEGKNPPRPGWDLDGPAEIVRHG